VLAVLRELHAAVDAAHLPEFEQQQPTTPAAPGYPGAGGTWVSS
jgi:hypothetical protein